MLLITLSTVLLTLISTSAAAQPAGQASSAGDSVTKANSPAAPVQGSGTPDQGGSPPMAYSSKSPSDDAHIRVSAGSVFGAGCRWDPTRSNIEEVTYQFRTGQAPPSYWFSKVDVPASAGANLNRRQAPASPPSSRDPHSPKLGEQGTVLDSSYHTRLIDVLTFRARFGSFGSSLNSAGCALPAFSARLAQLESQERSIVNNYTLQHKPLAGADDTPNAMFFWAGISNYNPSVRSDLIQTVVFYGDGCAANPKQGLCIYAAEYSNFRYDPADHMCMGSNMPVFYPVDKPMTVVYRTQNGFRTQEAWIDGKMVSYLRSAGDQVMNSFVITQECKGCEWPLTEQVYEGVRIKFTEKEEDFDKLGLCTGGATVKNPPRSVDGGKIWIIDEVRVPSGKHVTSTPDQGEADGTQIEQS